MRTLFLERDLPMSVLQSALSQAESGYGANVVISGEPGVGKSTLIEHFVRSREHRCKVLLGGCEMLSTPRPLGPLCDVAVALGEKFAKNFSDGSNTTRIFQDLVATLAQTKQPTVLVFEDIHWADFATMDLIKYLARRSMQLPLVFVLSYREQDVERDHPLRAVLGELPVANTKRIALQGLSRAGR
jgi:predicted ATPase